MSITLTQARRAAQPFRNAEVECLMGTFYHIHLDDGLRRHPLVDAWRQPLKLTNLQQVRSVLKQLPLMQAELVHRSAYGEMIGLDDADNSLRLPLTGIAPRRDTPHTDG
ncbi:DUF6482 family protein [Saccharospirillum salsuginis]|uniref:Uncharacterized protein n=1 Tax=Saccharospirillum salsuginis TaxID=418750 RepID=A0A918K1D4_9GAMM|nr:DUF6482 family protein [Saccharospirillum salsuginis]GGX41534.1 hypothetical protein GCM10007392_05570 [Saccharospirillum salsuginis]